MAATAGHSGSGQSGQSDRPMADSDDDEELDYTIIDNDDADESSDSLSLEDPLELERPATVSGRPRALAGRRRIGDLVGEAGLGGCRGEGNRIRRRRCDLQCFVYS